MLLLGHAITKTVGRWPVTVDDLVLVRDSPCGICCGQNGMGAGVFDCFGYPVCVVPQSYFIHLPSTLHDIRS